MVASGVGVVLCEYEVSCLSLCVLCEGAGEWCFELL